MNPLTHLRTSLALNDAGYFLWIDDANEESLRQALQSLLADASSEILESAEDLAQRAQENQSLSFIARLSPQEWALLQKQRVEPACRLLLALDYPSYRHAQTYAPHVMDIATQAQSEGFHSLQEAISQLNHADAASARSTLKSLKGPEAQKLRKVLAPSVPRTASTQTQKHVKEILSKSIAFAPTHMEDHPSQWLALRADAIVAKAPSYETLRHQLETMKANFDDLLIAPPEFPQPLEEGHDLSDGSR